MIRKDNEEKDTKPNPESSHKDDISSSSGEYTVPEASDNANNNDSYEEDQYGETDDL